MVQIPPAFTLLPQQCRMLNAAEGFRLEVRSGCLWLTRPGDAVDRFLVAGSEIELHEAQVLLQSDRHPGAQDALAARYVLMPLCAPSARRRNLFPLRMRAYWQGLTEICARATLRPARGAHGLR